MTNQGPPAEYVQDALKRLVDIALNQYLENMSNLPAAVAPGAPPSYAASAGPRAASGQPQAPNLADANSHDEYEDTPTSINIQIQTPVTIRGTHNHVESSPANNASAIVQAITRVLNSPRNPVPMIDENGRPRELNIRIEAPLMIDGERNTVGHDAAMMERNHVNGLRRAVVKNEDMDGTIRIGSEDSSGADNGNGEVGLGLAMNGAVPGGMIAMMETIHARAQAQAQAGPNNQGTKRKIKEEDDNDDEDDVEEEERAEEPATKRPRLPQL
jgi:ribosomal protein L12E/L44/L45/RPP1/RPP2